MNDLEVIEAIRDACAASGGIKKWATAHGLSTPYVSSVLYGRRALAPKILAAVGLKRVVVYQTIHPPGQGPKHERQHSHGG